MWLLCGGLRRQGDADDAYTYCCEVHKAEGLEPSQEDRRRTEVEEPFRRNLNFALSVTDTMRRGLAAARGEVESEIHCAATDGRSTFTFSLWCVAVDGLEELTCVVDLLSEDSGLRLEPEQLEALMATFLEGRPASELEFPWSPPRPIDPAREYCFRRLI